MELINGKQTVKVRPGMLATRLDSYHQVMIDIGTGDGRYVAHLAKTNSTH